MKKLKALIPIFMNEVIEHDLDKFNLKKNRFLNIIFERFIVNDKNKYLIYNEIVDKRKEANTNIQFNLNKTNEIVFNAKNASLEEDAILLRSMLYTYINNPVDLREKFIFQDKYNVINEAIKKKFKLSITFHNENRVIEPVFISRSNEERFNYICSYCYKKGQIVNYRLSNIEKCNVLYGEEQDKVKDYDIEEIKDNFDPYLSYNKEVKIKLTKKGKRYYEIFTYKPKILSIDGDIYTIEASLFKAQLFLGAFWDEVEVLEPKELRDWMKNKIESMAKLYQKEII